MAITWTDNSLSSYEKHAKEKETMIRKLVSEMKSKVCNFPLDKTKGTWYNIHKDSEGVSKPLLPYQGSKEDYSPAILRNLEEIRGAVAKALSKFNLREDLAFYPVIAGGVIRDLVFDTPPQDYDLFIDTSSLKTEEEKEDFHDLVSAEISSALNAGQNGRSVNVEEYRFQNGSKDKAFFVNNIYWNNFTATLQVISGELGLKKSSLDILKDFDYNMVEGVFDLGSGEVFLSDRFIQGMETKTVLFDRITADRRWSRIKNRKPYCPFGSFNITKSNRYLEEAKEKKNKEAEAKYLAELETYNKAGTVLSTRTWDEIAFREAVRNNAAAEIVFRGLDNVRNEQ